MIGASQFHDLDSYKSIGNCLTAPFVDLLAVGFAPGSSNSNVDERTDSDRKGIDRLSDLVNKIKQKREEINNYNKIEKEYYL